jgi:hypothetical protein
LLLFKGEVDSFEYEYATYKNWKCKPVLYGKNHMLVVQTFEQIFGFQIIKIMCVKKQPVITSNLLDDCEGDCITMLAPIVQLDAKKIITGQLLVNKKITMSRKLFRSLSIRALMPNTSLQDMLQYARVNLYTQYYGRSNMWWKSKETVASMMTKSMCVWFVVNRKREMDKLYGGFLSDKKQYKWASSSKEQFKNLTMDVITTLAKSLYVSVGAEFMKKIEEYKEKEPAMMEAIEKDLDNFYSKWSIKYTTLWRKFVHHRPNELMVHHVDSEDDADDDEEKEMTLENTTKNSDVGNGLFEQKEDINDNVNWQQANYSLAEPGSEDVVHDIEEEKDQAAQKQSEQESTDEKLVNKGLNEEKSIRQGPLVIGKEKEKEKNKEEKEDKGKGNKEQKIEKDLIAITKEQLKELKKILFKIRSLIIPHKIAMVDGRLIIKMWFNETFKTLGDMQIYHSFCDNNYKLSDGCAIADAHSISIYWFRVSGYVLPTSHGQTQLMHLVNVLGCWKDGNMFLRPATYDVVNLKEKLAIGLLTTADQKEMLPITFEVDAPKKIARNISQLLPQGLQNHYHYKVSCDQDGDGDYIINKSEDENAKTKMVDSLMTHRCFPNYRFDHKLLKRREKHLLVIECDEMHRKKLIQLSKKLMAKGWTVSTMGYKLPNIARTTDNECSCLVLTSSIEMANRALMGGINILYAGKNSKINDTIDSEWIMPMHQSLQKCVAFAERKTIITGLNDNLNVAQMSIISGAIKGYVESKTSLKKLFIRDNAIPGCGSKVGMFSVTYSKEIVVLNPVTNSHCVSICIEYFLKEQGQPYNMIGTLKDSFSVKNRSRADLVSIFFVLQLNCCIGSNENYLMHIFNNQWPTIFVKIAEENGLKHMLLVTLEDIKLKQEHRMVLRPIKSNLFSIHYIEKSHWFQEMYEFKDGDLTVKVWNPDSVHRLSRENVIGISMSGSCNGYLWVTNDNVLYPEGKVLHCIDYGRLIPMVCLVCTVKNSYFVSMEPILGSNWHAINFGVRIGNIRRDGRTLRRNIKHDGTIECLFNTETRNIYKNKGDDKHKLRLLKDCNRDDVKTVWTEFFSNRLHHGTERSDIYQIGNDRKKLKTMYVKDNDELWDYMLSDGSIKMQYKAGKISVEALNNLEYASKQVDMVFENFSLINGDHTTIILKASNLKSFLIEFHNVFTMVPIEHNQFIDWKYKWPSTAITTIKKHEIREIYSEPDDMKEYADEYDVNVVEGLITYNFTKIKNGVVYVNNMTWQSIFGPSVVTLTPRVQGYGYSLDGSKKMGTHLGHGIENWKMFDDNTESKQFEKLEEIDLSGIDFGREQTRVDFRTIGSLDEIGDHLATFCGDYVDDLNAYENCAEIPNFESMMYFEYKDQFDVLVFRAPKNDDIIMSRIPSYNYKQLQVQTIAKYPVRSRPIYARLATDTFNAITYRHYNVQRFKRVRLNYENEFIGMANFFFKKNWRNICSSFKPIGIDNKATIEWMQGRPDAVNIHKELNKILLQGFELNAVNKIKIHNKVESLLKDEWTHLPQQDRARIIAWQTKGLCAIFSPIFKQAKDNLKKILQSKVHYTDGLTPDDVGKILRTVNNCDYCFESDLSKQDRQTDHELIDLEMIVYKHLGVPDKLLDIWRSVHNNWRWRSKHLSGKRDAMRLTGQATTAIGNVITNMLVHWRFYSANKSAIKMVIMLGDDNLSLIDRPLNTNHLRSQIKNYYNMKSSATTNEGFGTFCGMLINRTSDGSYQIGPDCVRMRFRYECTNCEKEVKPELLRARALSYLYLLGGGNQTQAIADKRGLNKELPKWYDVESNLSFLAAKYKMTKSWVFHHKSVLLQYLKNDTINESSRKVWTVGK